MKQKIAVICIYGAGSRLEKSCINLKEKRNEYQGGYGKLITKGRQFFYDEEGNLAEENRTGWRYMDIAFILETACSGK